jgi:hypothetical protein
MRGHSVKTRKDALERGDGREATAEIGEPSFGSVDEDARMSTDGDCNDDAAAAAVRDCGVVATAGFGSLVDKEGAPATLAVAVPLTV